MPVDLLLADELSPVAGLSPQLLEDAVEALLAETGDARLAQEVCVRICGLQESQNLNTAYRGIDKPTNVLSFPADVETPGTLPLLGDIAICWPVVEEQARVQGKQVTHHLLHLFVHGLLHLLGHDHEQTAAAHRMEAKEVEVLARLHIANPYEV